VYISSFVNTLRKEPQMVEEVSIPDPDDDHDCGVDIEDDSEVTTDEDLPASEGGVA
jgi:hypothetical protein